MKSAYFPLNSMILSRSTAAYSNSNRLLASFITPKEIAAWKEKVAAAWDGIKVLDVRHSAEVNPSVTGESYRIEVTLDTNGLADDLGIEEVVYRTEDGQEVLSGKKQFKIVKKDGNIVTFELSSKVKNAGVFRVGYRIYPVNPELPHRMDFAFSRWI